MKDTREGKVKEQGSDDFREDEFGGLSATIDTIIRIPEPIAES